MESVISSSREATHERGAIPFKEFCRWAGISAPTGYKEVNEGRLELRKIGKKSVILRTEAERWLNNLPVSTQDTAA